jgi:sn-glycerol 3-phosphate transport system ATP-binding protein
MNIFAGKVGAGGMVEAAGGKLAFEAGKFNAEPGRAVQVGVRPEDLQYVPPQTQSGGLAFDGEFVEELGATRLFHGLSGGVSLVVAVAASTISEAKKGARVIAEADAVHLFDAETGQSLRRTQPIA